MSNDDEIEIIELIGRIEQAAPLGSSSVARPLDDLISILRGSLSEAAARRLMDALRNSRCFDALARAGDALLSVGIEYPYVRRQYAQALIENGQLRQALLELEALLPTVPAKDKKELSEALGLLGRTHKQRFVNWQDDPARAEPELHASIKYYLQGYDLDRPWHGANLIALAHRGERAGLKLPDGVNAAERARTLIADLGTPDAGWTPWAFASLGEAYLALGDYQNARRYYGIFAQHGEVSGFAVAGAVRQLHEIWDLEPDGSEGGAILAGLETRVFATQRGGALSSSPEHWSQLRDTLRDAMDTPHNKLEAILGSTPEVPIAALLALLDLARFVGQVVNRHKRRQSLPSGGTGFLLDGGTLCTDWKGRPLLLTNHHVLNTEGTAPGVAVTDADVVFQFWEGKIQSKTFSVKSLVRTSSTYECDFSLAELDDPDGCLKGMLRELNLRPNALGARGCKPPQRVYLVGHPKNRGLEFSLSDNEVLDHELDNGSPLGRRRIHYSAPTEEGMSGSPVVDADSLQVIGLHRQFTRRPLQPTGGADNYRANEAIWMASVVEACN